MVERVLFDSTEPFLFDRVADRSRLAVEEGSGRARTVSSHHLREFVERDILRLLSTSALEAVEDLDGFPRAQRSVINYGLPGLLQPGGRGPTPQSIAALIAAVIERFEPRLSQVRVVSLGDDDDTALNMRIDAELCSMPQTQRFTLDLEIDVVSGSAKMQRARRT